MFSIKESLNTIEKLNAGLKGCGANFRYEYMKVAIIGAGISDLPLQKDFRKKIMAKIDISAALDQVDESHPLIGD